MGKNKTEKRIAFLVYSRLDKLLAEILNTYKYNNIRIVQSYFNDTVQNIKELINNDLIDVIIAGGSNARIIKENFPQFPIVTLQVSGFDLLSACTKAKQISKEMAIVTYKSGAMWADRIKNFNKSLNIDVTNIQYYEINELDNIMRELKKRNIKSAIGASVVCDYAEKYGLKPILVYSEESIRESIEHATNLYENIKHEKEINNYLKAIIDFTYSGIIAIDHNKNITICNPIAEKILKINKTKILNEKITKVLPTTRLDKVLESGILETNCIQTIDKDTIINTHRIPINVNGEIVGAVATFHSVNEIQEIEQNIRRKIHNHLKGLNAKYTFNDIKGKSECIKQVIELSKIYSKSTGTVLIYGETGTGKELFAHSIHHSSSRRDKPFVAINCASLHADLLESELFGYEGGAFTGAKKEGKLGLFDLAHQGTILLDEISEMPLRLQTKLLRVLQEHEFLRIGGEKIIPVDVRVIATTNEDLAYKVNNNKFRQDLYYRLDVLNIAVPPLRNRLEDLPILIQEFVNRSSPKLYDDHGSLWNYIIEKFFNYDWPGNVRQLENAVQRLCAILEVYDNDIVPNDILENAVGPNLMLVSVPRQMKNEKMELLNILEEVQWNRQKAAKRLGISRTTLWRKMKNYSILDETYINRKNVSAKIE